ncbi:MAG: DNA double-strand break repair nuclease NurA [Chloroflexi bacterium]|nr:DNA double-strand break repair nuclease NurA [Chloroflexota bacterium]
MSLELNKLTHQVEDLGKALADRATEFEQRLPAAKAVLDAIGTADDALRHKVVIAKNFRWAGAIPTEEPVNAAFSLPPHPPRVNVIAGDGSQIHPDRHGIALYYLINVGSIVFRHGLADAPVVRSQPQVFYEEADLYEEDGGLIPGAMIDVQRDIAELGELARLAGEEAKAAPTVALLDNGLLLYITLQTPNQRLIDESLRDYLAQLDRLKASGAAVVGVVDRPRAAGVIRLLRLAEMEEGEIGEDTLRSLGPFQHMSDGMLFNFLRPGERSALFLNASPANIDRYGPRGHAIYFFYLNAGRPGKDALLRIEVPEWIAHDKDKLDLVHAAIVEQCRVPDGFPYVLMRAHELAVVTMSERRDLDQMVVGAMIRRGLSPHISQKAQGKAWTGAEKRRFRK